MKRALAILLALVAAAASGYVVFIFTSAQIQTIPQHTDVEDSMSASLSSSTASLEGSLSSSESSAAIAITPTPAPTTESASSAATHPAPNPNVSYADFTKEIVGNGESAVIFFHSSTSDDSSRIDDALKSLYKNDAPVISTFRIEFGTNATLQKSLGVKKAATLVKIDGAGKVLQAVENPSKDVIAVLLK